jgi:glucose/arabinose dehydrogenase
VRTVRTIHGLSTIGGGGLLDLALSPNYTQDNLVFAYITTRTDNRVVAFTLHGPITPVLVGIPRGPRDNTGRIAFGADGDLYVGTGDAGRPRLAADPRSLAGKVLRVTDIGRPAPGNPNPRSRVYASGMRTVNGLCVAPSTDDVFETAAAAGPGSAPINVIEPAASYGWPRPSARYLAPLAHLPAADASPGGCAVRNGVLFVTSLAGQALLAAPISLHNGQLRLGAFGASVHRYGRLRTVVAAADGALWLTTSNRDGHGTPVPADERVLRIIPSSGGGGSSPV